MKYGINKAILIGNVGNDPEFQSNGVVTICKLSIATSEKWKEKDGTEKESTDWHNLVFFGKLAELASTFIKKGAKIYVEGKIKNRNWVDKNNVKRNSTEIICDQMQMLSNPANNKNNENNDLPDKNYLNKEATNFSNNPQDLYDDIPF